MKCSYSCSFDGLFGKWYLMDEYSIQNPDPSPALLTEGKRIWEIPCSLMKK